MTAMNRTLLLLNALALAVLAIFCLQPSDQNALVARSLPMPHFLQTQRAPQLAVLTDNSEAHARVTSEHPATEGIPHRNQRWVF